MNQIEIQSEQDEKIGEIAEIKKSFSCHNLTTKPENYEK